MELFGVSVVRKEHIIDYLVEHWVRHVGNVVWYLVEIELTLNCWVDMVKAGFVIKC